YLYSFPPTAPAPSHNYTLSLHDALPIFDGDNVKNILRHQVVKHTVCPLSRETAAAIAIYAGRAISGPSVTCGHIVGRFGGQPVAPKSWIDCDTVYIAQGCGVIAGPGDDRFE